MRPRLLFLFGMIAALTVVAPAHAQRWSGSIKVGSIISTFNGDLASGSTRWDPRVGLVGGGAFGYDFGNGFVPQIEFIYVRKGALTDIDLDGTPSRIRSDITYLEAPFLLQYRFDTGGYVHPRLFAGPMAAFQLDATLTTRAKGTDLEITDVHPSLEKRDFGVVAGAALEIDVGSQRLSVEARLSMGMADITKPNDAGANPSLKNQGVLLLIGFVF